MDIRTISSAAYSRPPGPVTSPDSAAVSTGTPKADSAAAPYLSPVFQFDPVAKLTILSYRDPGNGQVTTQIPSERIVEQYRRNGGKSADSVPAETAKPDKAADTGPAYTNDAAPAPSSGSGRPKAPAAAPKPAESKPVEGKVDGPRVSLSV
ncbi:MAG: hypothetical protein WCF85_11100 [Rhodospirillaceae bacterium]